MIIRPKNYNLSCEMIDSCLITENECTHKNKVFFVRYQEKFPKDIIVFFLFFFICLVPAARSLVGL